MSELKYRPWFPDVARWMARNGLTANEIAAELGATYRTLKRWQNRYPELADALEDGRELADARVEDSLYKRACGGDTTACIFWLCNRRKDSWRHVQRIEHTGKDGQPIEHLTTDAVDREIARLEKELAKSE